MKVAQFFNNVLNVTKLWIAVMQVSLLHYWYKQEEDASRQMAPSTIHQNVLYNCVVFSGLIDFYVERKKEKGWKGSCANF